MFEADIEMQSQWMREEMRYGHAKTHGYPEKLRRLSIPQNQGDSVLSFMSRYWDAFQNFDEMARNSRDPRAVSPALQQLGKVPNGLVDKVGLMLWRIDDSKESYVDEAVEIVRAETLESTFLPESAYRKMHRIRRLHDTPIGTGIENLHGLVEDRVFDPQVGLEMATDNAVHGMRTWRAYLDYLRQNGFDATMPKPGLPSGQIEDWKNET